MIAIVQRAGFLTSVQDLGRTGFRQFGVSTSGALDPFALRVANLLVGNTRNIGGEAPDDAFPDIGVEVGLELRPVTFLAPDDEALPNAFFAIGTLVACIGGRKTPRRGCPSGPSWSGPTASLK